MSTERNAQLVNELFVSNLQQSIHFYTTLGFTIQRIDGHFAVMRWDNALLFLDERILDNRPAFANLNIRIVVDDVDHYWQLAQQNQYPVYQTIDDRYYGMRDFTILDPDGFGLRFASFI